MANLRKLAVPFIAGAGLLWLAAPIVAQENGEIVVTAETKVPEGYEPVKKTVSIADLDLRTEAGASEMEKRVGAAVDSICTAPPRAALWELNDAKKCSEFAWAGARPQMDAALKKARGG